MHAPRNELAWALLELLPMDSHLLPVGGWTSLASPGSIFRDLVLTSFYYNSPAAPSFGSIGAAPFWIAYKGPLRSVSCSLVKNALNFSFSAPLPTLWSFPLAPTSSKRRQKIRMSLILLFPLDNANSVTCASLCSRTSELPWPFSPPMCSLWAVATLAPIQTGAAGFGGMGLGNLPSAPLAHLTTRPIAPLVTTLGHLPPPPRGPLRGNLVPAGLDQVSVDSTCPFIKSLPSGMTCPVATPYDSAPPSLTITSPHLFSPPSPGTSPGTVLHLGVTPWHGATPTTPIPPSILATLKGYAISPASPPLQLEGTPPSFFFSDNPPFGTVPSSPPGATPP